jgi:hypothetical protein
LKTPIAPDFFITFFEYCDVRGRNLPRAREGCTRARYITKGEVIGYREGVYRTVEARVSKESLDL